MQNNDKRKKFIESFAVEVNDIAREKFLRETKSTTIGETIDGYKEFISDLGGGFLEIAENYNECIQIAKMNELIGDTKLKARIKDFSSSSINSNRKELDDVFGIEIVTATEFEKELLMLFNHLIFDINKDKKYNKKNGYVSYHCMGNFSPEREKLQERIKKIVDEAKTREYIYSKSEPNYDDKRKLVSVFPNLSEYIADSKKSKEYISVLEKMIEYMRYTKASTESIPIIEFHFLTTQVEQEAIRGRASHANYKKINTKLIEEYFEQGRLIRGINAPWKFTGEINGLKLQDFYDTLIENWPFLKKDIVKKRDLGEEKIEKDTISKFDILTASQFPFLRKYLKGNSEYLEEKKDEKWGLLKGLIIANKININEKNPHSAEDELISKIDKIWSNRNESSIRGGI